MKVSVMC